MTAPTSIVLVLVALLALACCPLPASADDGVDRAGPGASVSDETATNRPSSAAPQPRPNEQARRTYMGRIVAQPMSHLGAAWLVRPERNEEENALEAFGQLGIEPGMTLVDLGCGNGYWTLPMAKACKHKENPVAAVKKQSEGEPEQSENVAAEIENWDGQVIAIDIQREMLQKLRQNMARAGVDNVVPILGKVDDPRLPVGEVDLVLLVDVYHEFSHPESMLWSIRQSLKPEGVVALLEYRTEDPNVPIKPLHKMSKNQIMKEYTASNFKLVREYNNLPWQHLMFFARDDSPLPAIPAEPYREPGQ